MAQMHEPTRKTMTSRIIGRLSVASFGLVFSTALLAAGHAHAECSEIQMPWQKTDPCKAQAAPAKPPAPAVAATDCVDAPMPWDKLPACATKRRDAQAAAPAPANRAAPAANGRFRIGDDVEYDEFSNGAWGKFGKITSFNGDQNATCPWYYVKDAVSGLNISYVCDRVRAAAGAKLAAYVKRAAPAVPAGGPPLGAYFCTYGAGKPQVLGPGRNFRLGAGGRYAADDGESGAYGYDAATGRLSFTGGFFGRMSASGEFKGGRSNQIDISPAKGLLSFCSLQ